jgi:hypothetical protein
LNVLCRSLSLLDIPTSEHNSGRSEANHPAAGFQTQAHVAARDDGSFALEGGGWDGRFIDELTVDKSREERHVGQHSFSAKQTCSLLF